VRKYKHLAANMLPPESVFYYIQGDRHPAVLAQMMKWWKRNPGRVSTGEAG